jgi:hypothetical protein
VQVFIEEPDLPGRYRLIKQQPTRPAGEALDFIIEEALNPGSTTNSDGSGGSGGSGNFLDSIRTTMNSMQRFMRSLSN